VPSCAALRAELPFKADVITTRLGATVQERRLTCWLAEPGIGGLAYSGKIMPPAPLSPSVTAARDALAAALGDRYDCCLANHYNAAAACAWHSDPEHGSLWARDTAVVSIGETRRFAFRRLPPADAADAAPEVHAVYLFHGDVVRMWADCQDCWQHTVLPPEGAWAAGERASLVLKRALPRGPSARRGHGGVPGGGVRATAPAPARAMRPPARGQAEPAGAQPKEKSRTGLRVKKPPPLPLW
jgi:alkylated DNA repair dioxygenase AlkB